jgi:hypothetical protein
MQARQIIHRLKYRGGMILKAPVSHQKPSSASFVVAVALDVTISPHCHRELRKQLPNSSWQHAVGDVQIMAPFQSRILQLNPNAVVPLMCNRTATK